MIKSVWFLLLFWLGQAFAETTDGAAEGGLPEGSAPTADGLPSVAPKISDSLIYDSIGRLLGGLLLIVVMIFAAQWLMRKMQSIRPGGGQRHMQVIETVAVGQRERVVLLKYEEKNLLLGVAGGRVNILHVDEQGHRVLHTPDATATPPSKKPFAEQLAAARREKP